MEKIKRLSAVLMCSLQVLGVVTMFAACGNTEAEDTYIADPAPYHWENEPTPQPEMDEDVKIDGEFDDPVYQNIRWLEAVDHPDSEKSSTIRIGTAITEKGVYIAADVEETGSRIYVNPNRGNWCNSCIELYMELADSHDMTARAIEFDMVPNGTYSIRSRIPSRWDWKSAYAPNEIAPVTAAKTKGGELNSEDCYGYTYEAFLSKGYLEKLGYEFSEDMVLALNPVHIVSLDYNQENQLARIYSQWLGNYSSTYNWNNPNTWLAFDKNGVEAYDIETTITGNSSLGMVTNSNGGNVFYKGHDGELRIVCLNSTKLVKLIVDGKDALNRVLWTGDVGYLTIANPTANVEVEAEFSEQ